jgi:hypothetical protein
MMLYIDIQAPLAGDKLVAAKLLSDFLNAVKEKLVLI